MGRLRFDRAAFFEIHVADVAYGLRQQIPPLVLGSQQDQVDETFTHLRHQIRQVALLMPLDMFLHDFVYLAVQALSFGLFHGAISFLQVPGQAVLDARTSTRRCVYSVELDLATLAWTRGRDFPLSRLESRLKCPDVARAP